MLHKDQATDRTVCIKSTPYLTEEVFKHSWAEVGPLERCVEEDKGATMVDRPHLGSKPSQKKLGRGATRSSGPEFPLSFKDFIDVVRPSKQNDKHSMLLDIDEYENSIVRGNKSDQNIGESHGAF